MNARIEIPHERLASFCHHWDVSELAFFGSVLRPDFGPRSDIDLLVQFLPEARPTLMDIARMQKELSQIFGRPVDLLERRTIERSRDFIRKASILGTCEVSYAA